MGLDHSDNVGNDNHRETNGYEKVRDNFMIALSHGTSFIR